MTTETVEKKFTAEQLEEIENSHLGLEVWEAAEALDVQFEDTEEAYSGEFASDEEFAQDLAEQCDMIQEKVVWPYTCIDWEFAARELMMDYGEENGHYFRNF